MWDIFGNTYGLIFEHDNNEPRIFLSELDSDIHINRNGQCPNCEKLLLSEYLFFRNFFCVATTVDNTFA